MTTNHTPTTARALLAAITPFGPAADGEDLVFAADPPADLDPLLRVLHTGIRAMLAVKTWYGCDGQSGRVYVLSPLAPIPGNVTLLAVEGDRRWDRIGPSARLDFPRLFGPAPAAGPSRAAPKSRPHPERSGS